MTVWYFITASPYKNIYEICKRFSKLKIDHQNEYRVLRIFSLGPREKNAMDSYAEDRSIEQDLQGWFLSNILSEHEKGVLNKEEYRMRRFREIWNLLAKLSLRNGIRLIDQDNFLTQKTKDYLIKQIMRRGNYKLLIEV